MPRVPSASSSARHSAALPAPPSRRSSRLVSSLGPGSKPSASRGAVKSEGGVKAEPADAAAAAPTAAQLNVAEPFVKAEPSETPLDALPLAHDPARASAAHAALASGSSLAALLDDPSSPALRQAASRLKAASQRAEALHGLPPLLPAEEVRLRTHILRPALPYDFGAARAHLEEADPRFRILFHQADFRKYLANGNEGPENLNLFKSLATSILGQQISWKAARAICLKFLALFDASTLDAAPAAPASADEEDPVAALPFPTPLQVLALPEGAVRSAGVSSAKEKALRDIAHRFADGRLDARRLSTATTEAAWEEMISARGVGPWTVQMILMLALRMPDILPVGDVGVQNGMLKFFLAPATGPVIPAHRRRPLGAGEAETPPASARGTPALPSGMRPEMLRARLAKKGKKGAALEPDEMERLTESWRPFRSLACLLMWPIADVLV